MNPSSLKASSRREFFKKVLFYTSAGVLVQAVARGIAFGDDLKPIDVTGKKRKDADNKECMNIAVGPDHKSGLNYVDNLDAALKKGTIKSRKAGEVCSAPCMFYDWKKEGKPTCQLISKCLVNPKGSCNSWVKKV